MPIRRRDRPPHGGAFLRRARPCGLDRAVARTRAGRIVESAGAGSPFRMPRPTSFGRLGSAARSPAASAARLAWPVAARTTRCSTFGCRATPHGSRSPMRPTIPLDRAAHGVCVHYRTVERTRRPPARDGCRRRARGDVPLRARRWRRMIALDSALNLRRAHDAGDRADVRALVPASRRSVTRPGRSLRCDSGLETIARLLSVGRRRPVADPGASSPASVGSTCSSAIDWSSNSTARAFHTGAGLRARSRRDLELVHAGVPRRPTHLSHGDARLGSHARQSSSSSRAASTVGERARAGSDDRPRRAVLALTQGIGSWCPTRHADPCSGSATPRACTSAASCRG